MLKKYLNKIIKKLLSHFEGNLKYQNLFYRLFSFSLRGMNIGQGYNSDESGEKFVLQYLNNQFKNNKNTINIFDVGANIGNYSLMILDIFKNANTEIFSFEPSKNTFNKLKNNINSQSNIKFYNLGLSNENKKLILYSNKEYSGLASLKKRRLEHFNIKLDKTEEVETKTLDDFCDTNNIKYIHFLKLDIEGHELKVLQGAKRMLNSGSIDYIQFEFGGCNIDERTYFQDFWYLLNSKYKIYRIVKNGIFPINKYRETCEIFLNTNYLAIKK